MGSIRLERGFWGVNRLQHVRTSHLIVKHLHSLSPFWGGRSRASASTYGGETPTVPVNSDKVRLTLPTRIPLSKTFIYASLFFCVQQYEHTSLSFSMLYFAFLIVTVIAFNFAEGFTRLTGAYIFWYSTLIVIVGVTWKAVVGEAADSNLYTPTLDMALYTASMVMLLLVSLLNKKMDFRSIGIGGGLTKKKLNYTAAGLGCLLVGYSIAFADSLFGQAPGGIVSALIQVNVFPQLGVILATIGAIEDSGGRRSVNMVNFIGIAYFTFWGIVSFSKQASLTFAVCWLLGAFSSRLRLRPVHVVSLILMAVISFGFISPLSASRDLAENMDAQQRLELIYYLITHWDKFQAHVKDHEAMQEESGAAGWYNKAQGSLIERLSMIPPDDVMFAYTAKGHYEGIAPVVDYFSNLAPHFISPNKHITYSGNFYAHEIGLGLSEGDYSTGISFSPVGEAFHCEGWGGIVWLLPLIWILLFTTVDFVVGDMTKYPWGLMVVVWFAHAAPETLLGGMIYFLGLGNFGMFFAIVVVTRIAPVIGALFTGKTISSPTRSVARATTILSRPQA
jgi:hypothetical protein